MFEDFMKKSLTRFLCSLTFLGIFMNIELDALESDREQQVTWSADGNSSMQIIENRRILEMTTNVIVNQGSLEIKGDQAVFEYEASTNTLRKVQVYDTLKSIKLNKKDYWVQDIKNNCLPEMLVRP